MSQDGPARPVAPVARATPAEAQAGWWSIYGDRGLDAVMARLHAGNATIAQAGARLAMARADARLGAANRLPALELDGSAAHAGGPLVNAAGQSGNLYTLRAAATWELDLLGRLSDERRAARHEVGAAYATLADVTLLMEAAAARAWFARNSAALAASDAVQAGRLLQEQITIAESRQRLGLVTADQVDTVRQRAQAAAARARDLELARDSAGRQLAYLVGGDAGALAETAPTALPEPPPIPAGLPAEVLARRPDLRAAQARLAAADARLAAIRKGWLPPIALTAVQGQASPSLGQLFASAGGVFGLSALLAIPIFDGGRHRARVAHGKADRDLGEADYRERVAAALRDVYDNLQSAQVSRAGLTDARDSAQAAAAQRVLAEARAANGTISRAQWLEARLRALDRRISANLAQGESLGRLVTLQSAIGGSW